MVKGRPKGSNTTSLVKVPQLSQWAQCDNQGCAKWRRLPPGTVVDDTVPWYAVSFNPHRAVAPASSGVAVPGPHPSMPHDGSCSLEWWDGSLSQPIARRFCFMNPDELRNSCEAPEEVHVQPSMHALAPRHPALSTEDEQQ
jgi:hypothetical protein